MGYEFLPSDVDDAVTTLTLNRPQRLNALNVGIGPELLDAIAEFGDDDDDQRVLILAGAGRAFCSGDDLKRDGPPRKEPNDELDRIEK